MNYREYEYDTRKLEAKMGKIRYKSDYRIMQPLSFFVFLTSATGGCLFVIGGNVFNVLRTKLIHVVSTLVPSLAEVSKYSKPEVNK